MNCFSSIQVVNLSFHLVSHAFQLQVFGIVFRVEQGQAVVVALENLELCFDVLELLLCGKQFLLLGLNRVFVTSSEQGHFGVSIFFLNGRSVVVLLDLIVNHSLPVCHPAGVSSRHKTAL